MKPVELMERVTADQVKHLILALGPMAAQILDLGFVDLEFGRGHLGANDRCLWTKEGRRITISVSSDGGVVGSLSKEIDPFYRGIEKNDKPSGL